MPLGAIAGALAGPLLGAGANAVLGGGKNQYQANPANIQNPVTGQDLQYAQGVVGDTLHQQQQFVDALKAQNGIGNQSNVYNQFQNIAAGQGPNPAQAMLANATGQNNAAQAALMAGQRGASQNPALLARMAAQQGSANQQAAIGQGAALQAQQSLNALGQAGNIAGQQVGNQANAMNSFGQMAANNQGQVLNAFGNFNNAQAQAQSAANAQNAAISQTNQANQNAIMGGIGSALGTGITAFSNQQAQPSREQALFQAQGGEMGPRIPGAAFAQGGEVHHGIEFLKGHTAMARGGKVPALVSPGERYLPPKAAQEVAKGKKSPMKAGEKIPGKAKVAGNSLKNDTVKKNLTEGGIVIPRSVMNSKDPANEAAAFVRAHLGLKGAK